MNNDLWVDVVTWALLVTNIISLPLTVVVVVPVTALSQRGFRCFQFLEKDKS